MIGEQPALVGRRAISLRSFLDDLATALRSGDSRRLTHAQGEALGLVALRKSAGMLDRGLRGRAATDAMLIETLAELLTLQRLLPSDLPIEVRLPLAEACDASAAAFKHTGEPDGPGAASDGCRSDGAFSSGQTRLLLRWSAPWLDCAKA